MRIQIKERDNIDCLDVRDTPRVPRIAMHRRTKPYICAQRHTQTHRHTHIHPHSVYVYVYMWYLKYHLTQPIQQAEEVDSRIRVVDTVLEAVLVLLVLHPGILHPRENVPLQQLQLCVRLPVLSLPLNAHLCAWHVQHASVCGNAVWHRHPQHGLEREIVLVMIGEDLQEDPQAQALDLLMGDPPPLQLLRHYDATQVCDLGG